MDNGKVSALMYMAAGAFFVFSGFIGGNIVSLPIGVVLILLGLRNLRNSQ